MIGCWLNLASLDNLKKSIINRHYFRNRLLITIREAISIKSKLWAAIQITLSFGSKNICTFSMFNAAGSLSDILWFGCTLKDKVANKIDIGTKAQLIYVGQCIRVFQFQV